MSGFDRQQAPAKTSGVAAEDLVRAPDIGAIKASSPDLAEPFRGTGDQWIDHGAVCDGRDSKTSGCFLSDAQRLRLIIAFTSRVRVVSSNYKDALLELRVDKLLSKEEDLNWMLSLALDLAGAHLATTAAKALKAVTAARSTRLTKMALAAARLGDNDEQGWGARAESALNLVTDTRIDKLAKLGGDASKKITSAHLKKELNRAEQTEKEASVSYLAELRDSCDIAFQNFEQHALGSSSDAELFVLWSGLDASLHSTGMYKRALADKLARFHTSGVSDIGRKMAKDRDFHAAEVRRDTRVVFVEDALGGKSLWYQSQEGDWNPSVARPCDPGTEGLPFDGFRNATCSFGPVSPRGPARLERRVPDEFRDIAIARSELRWGPVETIDDWYASYLKRASFDTAKNQKRAPSPLPVGSVFGSPPSPSLRAPATGGVPSNSVFASKVSQ